MGDLFGREKYGPLPRALSKGERTHSYEVGDIGYWSPGPDVAIYYWNDGEQIPDPGLILIGKIDSGIEAFNVAGSLKVTIEPAGSNRNRRSALLQECDRRRMIAIAARTTMLDTSLAPHGSISRTNTPCKKWT